MQRAVLAAMAAVAMIGGLTAGGHPARASAIGGFGEVKGKVVDTTTGKPVKTACVIIWVQNGIDPPVTVAVDGAGQYDAVNVPTGAWKSTAYDCSAKPKYYSAMYGGPSPAKSVPGIDLPSGADVNVLNGVATTGVDFDLGKAALIKMSVRNPATKQPVQNVSICPQDASSGLPLGFCAPTDASGKSTIASVPGATKLYVLDNRASGSNPSPPGYPVNIYLPGTDFSGATVYSTKAGGNSVKFDYAGDVNEVGTGSVAGTITDKSGTPLANACASVVANGSFIGSNPTDATGRYTVTNVPNGSWEVLAGDCDPALGHHYFVVYKGQPGLDTSKQTLVQVLNGQTTPNINFALGASGQITVNVVDATTNQPIAGAGVTPYKSKPNINNGQYQSGFGVGDWTTGSDGQVLLSDIVPGSTKLIGYAPGYTSTWFGGTTDFNAAAKVTIAAGPNPSITIALQPNSAG